MPLTYETALVTGAHGFIGGHVARRLAEVEGMRVRALVRDPQGRPAVPLDHPASECIQGDILVPSSLSAACDGVDLVIHAAMNTRFARRKQVLTTGIEGTRNTYAAACAAGARRFIFLSSFSVYYGATGAPFDERTPLVPCGDPYADSKIGAEHFLGRLPQGGPVPVSVRPPFVYGPGSWQWSMRFLQVAKQRRLILPGDGDFLVAYTYIDNLVDAIVALAKTDCAGAFNIFDGYQSYRDLVTPYAQWAGTTPRRLPLWAFRTLAASVGSALRVANLWLGLSSHSAGFLLSMQQWAPPEATRARRELGWYPRVGYDEGMRRTELWLRQEGYLHPPWPSNA